MQVSESERKRMFQDGEETSAVVCVMVTGNVLRA